jgi:hypothetical protein
MANIRWTSSGLGSDTLGILLLSSSGSQVKYIANGISSDVNSYAWQTDPTIPSGTYAVSVYDDAVKAGGAVGTSGYFSIVNNTGTQAPIINSVSPGSGPPGIQITLNGSGFTATGNEVYVDGVVMPQQFYNVSNNGETLTFTLTTEVAFQAGTYNVYVTNANGTSNTEPFTIFSAVTATPANPVITTTSTVIATPISNPGTDNGNPSTQAALQQELTQLLTTLLQLLQQAAAQGLLSASQLSSALNTISH